MIRISIVEQGGTSRLVTFDQPQVTIGRLPENDLVLGGQGVSSRHARIFAAADGIYIEDVGSTNGTYVNRQRLGQATRVGPSDEVVLAIYQLRIFDGSSTATAGPPGGSVAPPMVSPSVRPQPAVAGSAPTAAVPPPTAVRAPTAAVRPPTAAAPSASAAPAAPAGTSAPAGVDAKAAQWAREWETIDVLARDWVARGRDRKRLLRGQKLDHAKRWIASSRGRQPAVTPPQKDLIRASHRAAQLRMFRNVAIGGVLLAGTAAGVVFVVAKPTAAELQRGFAHAMDGRPARPEGPRAEDRRGEADVLAKAASGQLESDPQVAALLAAAALERLPVGEAHSPAHDIVRRALERLSFEALRGHESSVYDAAISPDAKWAVTAGADLSARLWNLEGPGQRVPLSLRGHAQAVRFVAVSPDSHYVVTAGDDGKVYRWTLTDPDPLTTSVALPGHDAEVTALALSGNGKLLVTASVDGTVRLNAFPEGGGGQKLTDHAGPVRAVGTDAAGSLVVTGGADMTGILYAVADGRTTRRVRLEGHEGEVRAATLSPDGAWAITGSDDGTARLWEASRRAPGLTVRILAGHQGAVSHAIVTLDSKLAVTGGQDGKLFVWNLEADQPEVGATTFDLHQGAITDLGTMGGVPATEGGAPTPRWLLSASRDGTARTWNLETRERAQESVALGSGPPMLAVASDPAARRVVTGGDDGLVRLWDPHEKEAAGASRVARGGGRAVLAIDVNRVVTRLAAAGDDGVAILWDLISAGPPQRFATLTGHQGRVRTVAFSPNSDYVATAGDDGVVRLWNTDSPTPGHLDLRGHSKVVNEVRFTPDGRHLVSISADRSARVWKMSRDPSKTVTVLPHRDEVNAMGLSADGRWLMTGSISRLRVFDLSAADVSESSKGLNHPHDKDISVVAVGPKGKFAVSASVDAVAVLWNLSEGNSTRLRQHDQPVKAAAFSPDGRWLATGSEDQRIVLYDLRKEHPEESSMTLSGHDKTVGALRFSEDGRLLVSGSNDGTIRLWDLQLGGEDAISEASTVLRGHDGLVGEVRIASDGRLVASSSYDGTARVWPLLPEALIELACRRVGRSLTSDEWKQWAPGLRYRAVCEKS